MFRNSNSDILPTGRHRQVSSSRGPLGADDENKGSSVLFVINLFLVGLILYITYNEQSKYSELSERYQIIIEKKSKIVQTTVKDLGEQLKKEQGRKVEAKEKTVEWKKKIDVINDQIKEEKEKHDMLDKENKRLLINGNDKIGKTVSMLGHAYTEEQLRARFYKQKENVKLLKKRLQDLTGREVQERFGKGPHRVKFDVFLPAAGGSDKQHASFVVETAPLDVMPHAVHLFLEQVYHHLWDGCAFLLCDAHRVQASPFRDIQLTDRSLEKKFKKLDLDTVAFQEYSEEYPHRKWTLGYSGRPGGPDFYINTDDNSGRFGPAGKESKVLEEEADPCFATVVEGQDVIERMMQLPKINENGDLFKEPVVIVSATLQGIKPGLYRQSFYDQGYYALHDNKYYEETKEGGEQEVAAA